MGQFVECIAKVFWSGADGGEYYTHVMDMVDRILE